MRKGIRKISSVLLALLCAAVFTACDFTGGLLGGGTESGYSQGSDEISSTVITVPASDDNSLDSSSDSSSDGSSDSSSDGSSDSSSDGSSDSSSDGDETVEQEVLSIHFLELGNQYTGDATLIKVGDVEVLIDAGSRKNSAKALTKYIDNYCEDGVLEYVIATHAHQDHIAGFVGTSSAEGIFAHYECETIIDYPRTDADTQIRKNYESLRDEEVAAGATHYTALECYNGLNGAQRVYSLGEGVTMEILYQRFYEEKTSDENDYSVCLLISRGDNHFLFTGDLEERGEASLVQSNELPKCVLFKGGHHGSPTSSTDVLLKVIQPKIVCVCCCCGSTEYTTAIANVFPSQAFVDRIAQYTDRVYVTTMIGATQKEYTSMNGNIVVSELFGEVSVQCSNNDTLFKDTDWFKENRTLPDAWKS